ncbi:hypothetical protein A3Q56_00877 [Intoshia linei]|uniref:Uncharacterized protein n=1 Tax=Intoshia linei TaxID=1819745 RepID=A0A177BCB4_9BILA|nr:hypothetical protein A3Q56_00877 [Intoshia linei]
MYRTRNNVPIFSNGQGNRSIPIYRVNPPVYAQQNSQYSHKKHIFPQQAYQNGQYRGQNIMNINRLNQNRIPIPIRSVNTYYTQNPRLNQNVRNAYNSNNQPYITKKTQISVPYNHRLRQNFVQNPNLMNRFICRPDLNNQMNLQNLDSNYHNGVKEEVITMHFIFVEVTFTRIR